MSGAGTLLPIAGSNWKWGRSQKTALGESTRNETHLGNCNQESSKECIILNNSGLRIIAQVRVEKVSTWLH